MEDEPSQAAPDEGSEANPMTENSGGQIASSLGIPCRKRKLCFPTTTPDATAHQDMPPILSPATSAGQEGETH